MHKNMDNDKLQVWQLIIELVQLLPTVAALPLLVVYYITTNRTDIVVPLILR